MACNVRVVCRTRPLNRTELARGGYNILEYYNEYETMEINKPDDDRHTKHKFNFDRCFPPESVQADVYNFVAEPILLDVFQGYNGTLFVYGQTGSGKTHTMMGPDGGKGMEDMELKGIVPRLAMNVFDYVEQADEDIEFTVKASFLEIYMEKIKDLLDTTKVNLRVREEKMKGVYVDGATEVYCSNDEDVMDVLRLGQVHRSVAATKMNAESSRSHSIFIITVTQKSLKTGGTKSGKFFLVDLAGSEKVEKTGATGQTLEEAKMINKSLTALGQVINALTDSKSKHIPYRDSKLTRLLQNSLGGNSRTTLCINCSPSDYNYGETLSTLRFGQRAKSIKNNAKVNQERSAAELMAMLALAEKEIGLLKTYIDQLVKELLSISPDHQVPPMSSVVGSKSVSLSSNSTSAADGEEDDDSYVAKSETHSEDGEEGSASDSEERFEVSDDIMSAETEAMSEEQVQAVTSELNEKIEAFQSLMNLHDSLQAELHRSLTNHQEFENQNKHLSVRKSEMELEKESNEYEATQLQLTIEEMTSQRDLLEEEKSELEHAISALEERVRIQNDLLCEQETNGDVDEEGEDEGEQKSEEGAPVMKPSSQTLAMIADFEQAISTLKKENGELMAKKTSLEDAVSSVQFSSIAQEIENDKIVPIDQGVESDLQSAIERYRTLELQHRKLRQLTFKKFKEFDSLKTSLLRDLQNRCEKVIDLKILLAEARDQHEKVVNRSGSKAKTDRKVIFLENHLERLTQQHHKETNQNHKFRAECDVCQKKVEARDKRVAQLEQKLANQQREGQDQVQELQNQIREIKAQMEEFKRSNDSLEAASSIAVSNPHHSSRIAKPIRGGGNKKNQGFFGGLFGGKQQQPIHSSSASHSKQSSSSSSSSASSSASTPNVSSSSRDK